MAADATAFVVDDDEALRDSLRWLFESVGVPSRCFASAQEFLAEFNPDTPGCLVLDVRMPGMSGLQLQEHLTSRGIPIPIIVLTAHADVPMAVRAMKAGALDLLTKPCNTQELLDRVRYAIDQDDQRRKERNWATEIGARFALLTPRERQVMERVVSGKANKVIASELGVSTKTIEAHRTHIMEKTKAESVADLVRMAIACGAHRPGPGDAQTPAAAAKNASRAADNPQAD
jgi:FixJ family two-component response regulator